MFSLFESASARVALVVFAVAADSADRTPPTFETTVASEEGASEEGASEEDASAAFATAAISLRSLARRASFCFFFFSLNPGAAARAASCFFFFSLTAGSA